jgi:hypothetical protein
MMNQQGMMVMQPNGMMVQQQPMMMQQPNGMMVQQQPMMMQQQQYPQQQQIQQTGAGIQMQGNMQVASKNGIAIQAADGSGALQANAGDGGKTEAAAIKDKTKTVTVTKAARDQEFILATVAAARTPLQELRSKYGTGKAFKKSLEAYIDDNYRNPSPMPDDFVPLSEASIRKYQDKEEARWKAKGKKVDPNDIKTVTLEGSSIKIMRRGQIKQIKVEQPVPKLSEDEAPCCNACFGQCLCICPAEVIETEQDPRTHTYIYKLCEECQRPDTDDIQSEEYRGHTKFSFKLSEPAKSGPFSGQMTLELQDIANGPELMAKFEEWWM